jgi:hypothetical protein
MRGQADRLLAPALLIVAGLGFAACTPASSPAGSWQGSPSASAPSTSIPSPSAPSVPATAESGGAPAAPTGDLLGLDEATLKRWFGAPSFIRRDYPAEVWQYRAKACVLELYLYPADDHMAVTHAEATSGGAQSTGDTGLGPCLAALAEAKRKPAQS